MKTRPNEPAIDERAHLNMEELDQRLRGLKKERSKRLQKIVQRQSDGSRLEPSKAYFSPKEGLHGDRWFKSKAKKGEQIAIMDTEVASIFANGQSLTLFGDNLFLDLDLAETLWPAGARFQLGEVIFEISSDPHDGCSKFAKRFGKAALRKTCKAKALRLRGVYAFVIQEGWIQVGANVLDLQC